MAKVLRYNQTKSNILHQISALNLQVGDVLPPERTLSTKFGISMGTLRRALAELESQSIIEKQHGRGNIVKNIKNDKVRFPGKLGLPVYIQLNPCHLTMIQEISNQAVKMGFDLRLGQGEAEEEFIEKLVNEDVHSMLRLPLELVKEPYVCKVLQEKNIRTVMINNFWFDAPDFPSVRSNLEPAIAEVVETLAANGHRRIAFVDESNAYPRIKEFATFYSHMIRNGMPYSQKAAKMVLDYRDRADGLEQLWRELTDNFTAAVFTYDFYAVMFMDFLKRNDLTPGSDFSVVGIDDIGKSADIGLATIRHPIQELVQAGLEMLASPENYKPGVLMFDARFINRSSVGPAPENAG